MVRGLHHVTLLIVDQQRSQRFYAEILGLTQIERPARQCEGLWFALSDDGAQQLHLLLLPEHPGPRALPEHAGRDDHFALLVDDLPAYIERLEWEGVRYTISRSGREAAFLRDPDGHGIELIVTQAD